MTDIVCIIDKSGSMAPLVEDTIGSFNTFIKEQQALPGKAKVTLAMFDHNYHLIYSSRKLKKVEKLDTSSYVPSGTTALLDAVGRTLADMEKVDKAICVIITDGFENSSKDYTRERVKKLIETNEESGWEFHYLGVGVDNFDDAIALGIKPEYTMAFTGDAKGLRGAYAAMSDSAKTYREGDSADN